MSDLPVIVERFYGFLLWIFERTAQYPRQYRYSLGEKIQNVALGFLDGVVQAAYRKEKKAVLQEANRKLEVLRGGSWNNNNTTNFRAANRNRNKPDNRNNNRSFRCAKASETAERKSSLPESPAPTGAGSAHPEA